MKNAIYLLIWLVMAANLNAATGSAETGDVTVDTRSNNADLSTITISSGTLVPNFAAATMTYTASVGNSTTEIMVTPTVAEVNATIAVRINNGSYAAVTSGNASGSLALNIGDNTIDAEVTAQDTSTTKAYTVTVTRDKADQTITFDSIGEQFATAALNLFATGGGSGNPVNFAVTSGPGSINDSNQLTFTGSGSVTITASQAGNSEYHAATPVAHTLTVSLASQTITFDPPRARFISEMFTLAATGGGSSSGLVYEILDGPGEIANGNELTFTNGGSVTVRATQSGDDLYDTASPVDQTFEVVLPKPDIAVGSSPSELVGVDIYLPTGQLVSLTSKKARPVSGYVALTNRVVLPDDRAMDQVALRGAGGNALFKVTYLGPAGNVTAGVITGTFLTAAIDGDDTSVVVRAAVTPNKKKLTKKKKRRKIYLRKTFTSLFQGTSMAWPDANDAATMRVLTR